MKVPRNPSKKESAIPATVGLIVGRFRSHDPRIQRDTILEHDATYEANLVQLIGRITTGKLERGAFRRYQPILAMAALRRAGLSLKASTALLKA